VYLVCTWCVHGVCFKQAVNCSLKSGSVGNNCIRIEFRLDVCRFLFCDKGQPPILIYDLDDFDDRYFVGEWYRRYTRAATVLPQVDTAGLFKGT